MYILFFSTIGYKATAIIVVYVGEEGECTVTAYRLPPPVHSTHSKGESCFMLSLTYLYCKVLFINHKNSVFDNFTLPVVGLKQQM